MRYDGVAYLLKRESHLASRDSDCQQAAPYCCETLLVKRISVLRGGASRFTLHERRSRSQAGC